MADGFEVKYDTKDLLTVGKAFRESGDKTLMRDLRKALRDAAKPVADDARAIAGQVSSKVASTISITIDTQRPRKAGVFIKANRSKMPKGHEALPGLLEKGSKGNPREIRHPLFGDKTYWYGESVHPFLQPALEKNRAKVEQDIEQVVIQNLRKAGL